MGDHRVILLLIAMWMHSVVPLKPSALAIALACGALRLIRLCETAMPDLQRWISEFQGDDFFLLQIAISFLFFWRRPVWGPSGRAASARLIGSVARSPRISLQFHGNVK